MTKNRIVAAVDVGSSKVATLIAQIAQDAVTFDTSVNIVGVSSVASKGIKKGQIVDIEEAVEAIIASVESAERMAGYNLDATYVSLGGAHIHSQNSHGVVAVSEPDGEINDQDVNRVIEAASAISLPQSREVIHVLPREFVVDGESGVKDPVGMSGVRLEVETHIVTGATAAIKNLSKALNEVGIKIEGLAFSGIASAESVLSSTEKELGCCVIDIGGGTTSIAAYLDGGLAYSGVIPIGAKNVTNDLAIGLRISLETAERIKIALSDEKKLIKGKEEDVDNLELKDLGVSEVKKVSKKTLTEGIIRPRLNEIFTMARIELEKADIANRIPSGVVITGGGAQTVGALDAGKRMLALPVRKGLPKGVTGLIDDIIHPSFATAIGLVLYGEKMGQEPSQNGKKSKIPSFGALDKIIESIKNLLP